jgi:hypothetical protein
MQQDWQQHTSSRLPWLATNMKSPQQLQPMTRHLHSSSSRGSGSAATALVTGTLQL